MTNAQVQEVVANAALHSRSISYHEATQFLGAKELLISDPENEYAQHTVAEFSRFFTNGTPMTSFARFMMGIFYTDESKAESARLCEEFLAHQAKQKQE